MEAINTVGNPQILSSLITMKGEEGGKSTSFLEIIAAQILQLAGCQGKGETSALLAALDTLSGDQMKALPAGMEKAEEKETAEENSTIPLQNLSALLTCLQQKTAPPVDLVSWGTMSIETKAGDATLIPALPGASVTPAESGKALLPMQGIRSQENAALDELFENLLEIAEEDEGGLLKKFLASTEEASDSASLQGETKESIASQKKGAGVSDVPGNSRAWTVKASDGGNRNESGNGNAQRIESIRELYMREELCASKTATPKESDTTEQVTAHSEKKMPHSLHTVSAAHTPSGETQTAKVHITDLVRFLREKLIQKPVDPHIQITLDPPGLGEVDVSITMRSQKLDIQFNVQNQLVKDILEQNLGDLVSRCAQNGVNIGSFNINHQNANNGKNNPFTGSSTAGGETDEDQEIESISDRISQRNVIDIHV